MLGCTSALKQTKHERMDSATSNQYNVCVCVCAFFFFFQQNYFATSKLIKSRQSLMKNRLQTEIRLKFHIVILFLN